MDIHGVKFLYGILAVAGILVLAWFALMFVVSRFSDGMLLKPLLLRKIQFLFSSGVMESRRL